MKLFCWYPIFAIITSFPGIITAHVYLFYHLQPATYKIVYVLTNLSLLVHYTFLSIFITRVIVNKEAVKKYLHIIFFTFLIVILYFLITENIEQTIHKAYVMSSLGLTIFCIIYYYQLFNYLPIFNLRTEPSFWIVSGIFFAMSIHIPVSAGIEYLQDKISEFDYLMLYNFLMFSYTIMHLFFVKAFICTIKMHKV